MAQRKTQATVYECDKEDCNVARVYIKGDEELPEGVYIKSVTIIHAGGDGADDIYACSFNHVADAIRGALDRR